MLYMNRFAKLFIVLILFIFDIAYGDVRYFSQDGKEITKIEYIEITERRTIEIQNFRNECNKLSSASELTIISKKTKERPGLKELDSRGRPMFDSQGNMIIYSEQEKDMKSGPPDLRFSPAFSGNIGITSYSE
jgi:hypothetical protein